MAVFTTASDFGGTRLGWTTLMGVVTVTCAPFFGDTGIVVVSGFSVPLGVDVLSGDSAVGVVASVVPGVVVNVVPGDC